MSIIISAAAVIVVCIMIVVVAVLKRLGKYDIVKKIEGYQGIALKIFERVEKAVPDDYGTGEDDPAVAKAAHKLDLFVKNFVNYYEAATGDKANEALKAEVKVWALHWAEARKEKEDA